jgi:hypothetical protein
MLKKAILATLVAVPILLQAMGPACAEPQSNHDKVLIAKKEKHKKNDDGGLWQHDLQSGLALAQQQNKLVFVDIGAPW